MNKTTNILLIIVIVLLVALLVDRGSRPVYAGTSSGSIIFEQHPIDRDTFYLIDTENKIILHYLNRSNSGINLKAWRRYDFDSKLNQGQFLSRKAEGEGYNEIKTLSVK